MIYFKTKDEIELIRLGSDILGRTHGEIAKALKPGITTKVLDSIAYEFIKDNGGIPSFLNYDGFPSSLCISVNYQVVHGLPSNYVLQEGDIISVDCGVFYKGYHSYSAYTYPVGLVSEENKKLLDITKKSLYAGISAIKKGARIGDIAFSIQSLVESNKFSIVRELVGHGVGKNLHEDPQVPNYGRRGSGLKLQDGMVLAIEPMVNAGKKSVIKGKDGWTIETADYTNSAHFEHTVAIVNGLPDILTTFKYIEEVLN